MATTQAPRAALPRAPRVVLADRGDPLVAALSQAMRARFDVIAQLDTELTRAERLLVAATTFTPNRSAWAERFYKSNVGVDLRTRRARRRLGEADPRADVVFQTHALFEVEDPRAVMYVDCTHRQSMAQWPAWNPLHGRSLAHWLERESRQYQRAAHVFAFSAETADSVVEEYGVDRGRVSVVGAGVNFARLPALVERTERVVPTILFVGNDFERKGGRRLLEAFALLRRRVPSARLRIVGTPQPLPAQEGVEQLGRVRSRDQLSRLYATADVFCLPSFYDPFPGALLEAMAHGLPAVVTGTCGVPEMIEDGGTALTVSRGSTMVTELADALEQLLTTPEKATEMGLQARWRVEDHFLWSHVVDRMAPVVHRLAGTTTPTPDADVADRSHGRVVDEPVDAPVDAPGEDAGRTT